MTENQKLREVATELDRLMLVIESAVRHADPRNHASVMALILANKEALALPTAAPVGERDLPPLPSYVRWEERIKTLMQQCGHPNSMSIYQAFKQFQNEFEHEMIAYARAALSDCDAVDAQRYRWLKGRSQVCLNQVWIGGYTTRQRDVDFLSKEDALSAIDTAIDAAMRKGQL